MTNYDMVLDALLIKNEYRDKLNFSSKIKFGLEIEMDHVSYNNIKKLKEEYVDTKEYNVHEDTSLGDGGIELSTKVFKNDKNSFDELNSLSKYLKKLKPSFERSSLQVNVDCHFSYNELIYFLEFYAYYENIIYRISRGNDRLLRYYSNVYAESILEQLKMAIKYSKNEVEATDFFLNSKSFGIGLKDNIGKINSKSGINVIEFRTPNGTVDSFLWQQYINIFQSMVNYIESNDWYRYNFIDLDNISNDEFDLNKAIEFANIIFVDEKDKLLFLKQYIGNRKVQSLMLVKKGI